MEQLLTLAGFRKNKNSSPDLEYSLKIRYLVLAAMLVPLIALVRVRGSLMGPVLIAAIGIGWGHWYSYKTLGQNRKLVKAIMFVAIHVALVWMCSGLFIGTSVPQAQFAVFSQAITSFDLRYRRSLLNTLLHSLVNLYVAATLSRTIELAVYLILFAVLVLAIYFEAGKTDGLKSASLHPKTMPRPQKNSRAMATFGFSFGGLVLLGIVAVYLITPRFANRPLVPPFSLDVPLSGSVKAEIINPGVPLVQLNGWNDGSSDYFYGFDSDLDLRYRGGLSDAIVMYVRSPSRSYWRSHSYDYYTGTGWSQSDKSVTEVDNGEGTIYHGLRRPLGGPVASDWPNRIDDAPGEQIVQTYTIVREQPNLIFAAYRPSEIYMYADNISIDSGDGLRAPEPLQVGVTYSVVSFRPDFDPDLLRQASADYPRTITRRYLQLPDTITDRTRQLALNLTASQANDFDKVMALNTHLLTEYPYNFFPPPHPEGADVVDTFLFRDKEGVCEQYVTALVVMARSLGIPARLVTGYGSGTYNQLTGYYEVQASDAHSWAEVYFPGYGWVPFDPTPGWIPQPYPTPVQTWFLSGYGDALLELDLPLGAMFSSGMAGVMVLGPFLVGILVLAVAVVALLFLRNRWRKRLSGSLETRYSPWANDRTRRLILKRYWKAMRFLVRRKYRRREPWETAAEYAAQQSHLPALAQLTQAAEVAAYRPDAPNEAMVSDAETAWKTLKSQSERK